MGRTEIEALIGCADDLCVIQEFFEDEGVGPMHAFRQRGWRWFRRVRRPRTKTERA